MPSDSTVIANRSAARIGFLTMITTAAVVWTPSNALAIVAPFAFLFSYVIVARDVLPVLRFLSWFVALSAFAVPYRLIYEDFIIQNILLLFINLSGFFVLLSIPREDFRRHFDLDSIRPLVVVLLLIQGAVGILQAMVAFKAYGTLDTAAGDYVSGTMFLGFRPQEGFSNPSFAVNMIVLLSVGAYLLNKRFSYILFFGLCIGGVAFLLASVTHVLAFSMFAFLGAVFLTPPVRSRFIQLILPILLMGGGILFMAIVMPKNLTLFAHLADQLLQAKVPRTEMLRQILGAIPNAEPISVLMGFGPGQFGSRASLMGTGLYFGSPISPLEIPIFPAGVNSVFQSEVYYIWWWQTVNSTFFGSTVYPFNSWFAVYLEYGLIGILFVCAFFFFLIAKSRRITDMHGDRPRSFLSGFMTIFLFLLGAQENYWETMQAIFIGLVILRIILTSSNNRPASVS